MKADLLKSSTYFVPSHALYQTLVETWIRHAIAKGMPSKQCLVCGLRQVAGGIDNAFYKQHVCVTSKPALDAADGRSAFGICARIRRRQYAEMLPLHWPRQQDLRQQACPHHINARCARRSLRLIAASRLSRLISRPAVTATKGYACCKQERFLGPFGPSCHWLRRYSGAPVMRPW